MVKMVYRGGGSVLDAKDLRLGDGVALGADARFKLNRCFEHRLLDYVIGALEQCLRHGEA